MWVSSSKRSGSNLRDNLDNSDGMVDGIFHEVSNQERKGPQTTL